MPADPSARVLSIWLPEHLQTEGGSNVLQLAIIDDEKIQGGRRAIQRSYRPANTNDPGRIRRVEWNIWGPIGSSLESSAGLLGPDFAQNMDTRWARRLVAGVAQNYVDLTSADPPGIAGAYFGTAIFGVNYFGSSLGGGSTGLGPDVVVFAEQGGYLLAYRGTISTQIDIGPFVVLSSVILPAVTYDADHWRQHVRVAVGGTSSIQTLSSIGPGTQTYVDTISTTPAGPVYAFAIKRGSDRAWYIDASSNESRMGYTLDAFVNLANPFQVGDPDVQATGIGPFGPLTMIGAQDNLYSFTDQGKPVPLSRALYSHHSQQNGAQWADPGWGWNYALTAIGLRAVAPGVDNPVGPGESMRLFTGHAGVPISIYAERGELWVVYQTPQGAYYGYRGAFTANTATTGQPAWFPWFYETAAPSNALFSSTTETPFNQTFWMIRSRGTNMAYMFFDETGRDDLNPNYQYSRAGGTLYLTTLDRDANLLKVLRLIRGRARNIIPDGSSFDIEMAFDSNPIAPTTATYTTIGTVTADGSFTIIPNSGTVDSQGNSTPTADISGRTMKPRVTLNLDDPWETYVNSFLPKAYWPLGEASGDALDASGNDNDGTVTLGAGERDTAALNFEGDGSITADGSATNIAIAASTTIQNFWVGGSTLMFMCQAVSAGEGTLGVVIGKGARWVVNLRNPSTSTCDLRFTVDFATTDGIWDFEDAITFDENLLCFLGYTPGSSPTLTVFNRVSGESVTVVATVIQAPVGAISSDAGIGMNIGNNAGGTATFDGVLDEIAMFKGVLLSASQIETFAQVNASTVSPELDGTLEVEYDERPDNIEEVEVAINITGTGYSDNYIWDILQKLSGENATGPFQIQLPDDQSPEISASSGGGAKYAMVADVTGRQDITDNSIESVTVKLHIWPRAGALENAEA